MSDFILSENIPGLGTFIFAPNPSPQAAIVASGLRNILNSGYEFSRMLHASKASSGGTSGGSDAFYRAFVPELGSVLYPTRIELLKRCRKHEMGEIDRVGACVFPVCFISCWCCRQVDESRTALLGPCQGCPRSSGSSCWWGGWTKRCTSCSSRL